MAVLNHFAINKIIFDYLQAEKDVQLDSTVVQALSRLLDVKPEYDWMPLNWYVNLTYLTQLSINSHRP